MSSSTKSIIEHGSDGIIVDIECHLSNNLPTIVIVGFANRAVDEARERVRGAFASSTIPMPRKRITINLAPADIPKQSSSFDLPIAAAIIEASCSELMHPITSNAALMGELGLDGSIRPVRGIIGKIIGGRSHGITTFYIPSANLTQAKLVPGVELVPLRTLTELYEILIGTSDRPTIRTGEPEVQTVSSDEHFFDVTPADIVGQARAKRALEIAAAGGHNILFHGPPGTGKSMLARALPAIMPNMTAEETLDVTHLHSLAGHDYEKIINERPFRSPHHSASQTAVVGGGTMLRPGEISLAHHGILFFDEFPEFNRTTIEALRQPLEDGHVTISRARDSVCYPANFILVATANPCPCGYYGFETTLKRCECSPMAVQNYRSKLSGPILDRIDLHCDVHEVDHQTLLSDNVVRDQRITSDMQQRVGQARRRQFDRNGGQTLNSVLSNRQLTAFSGMQPEARALLNRAASNLQLSARSYIKTVKVGRTIADLAGINTIMAEHISEALQYRSR